MDFNSLDKKGSTPLHWASYLGCENSVNFLTTYGGEINLPDEEGSLTPLHLAVISGTKNCSNLEFSVNQEIPELSENF